jgi:hypothetical protein
MTVILPGSLGLLFAGGLSAWDTTTTGWGTAPGLFTQLPKPGTLGGPSIAPLVAPTSITETFGTVENPLSNGGQWQHQTTYWANMAVGSFSLPATTHVCYGLQTGANIYGDAYSYLSPLVWPPSHTDYTVAATINRNPVLGPGGTTDEYECVLRVTDSAAPAGTGTTKLYECNYQIDGAYAQFVAWDGGPGIFTILYPGPGTQPALVTGDVLAATIQGLTVTFKRNGVTLFTQTDPGTGGGDPNYTGPFPTGQPGIAKFYQSPPTGPDHYGFTQVVITSAPYTAPTPAALSANVASTVTAGTILGQISCQHNPTSWSVVPGSASPAGTESYWTIDSFANVVVQAAAVGNITASLYTFTAQATNAFGSNTAAMRFARVGTPGPVFSNGNHTIIDGDNSHARPLAVRGKNSVLTTGTATSRRRYVEIRLGSGGDASLASGFISAGVVFPGWSAPTVGALPLGLDTTGFSVGCVASGGLYIVEFAGSGIARTGTAHPGDIIGIAIDNSGVNFPSGTAVWFSVNGVYQSGSTTFPGLATPDMATTVLSQAWPAGSTDFQTHVTINPSPTQLYRPAGFLPLG